MRVYDKGVKLSSEVKFSDISEKAEDFTGADLANLINHSVVTAVNNDCHKVRTEDSNQAVNEIKAKHSLLFCA